MAIENESRGATPASKQSFKKNCTTERVPKASFSIFRNSFDTKPAGEITLEQLAADIQGGKWRPVVERLRAMTAEEYSQNKRNLPAVAFGGTFTRRRKDALVKPSGLVVLDIDHIAPVELAEAKARLTADPHTAICFVSPSGNGLKAVFSADFSDDATFKQAYRAIANYLKEKHSLTLDESGKDVCRLCYVSHDQAAHFNADAARFCYEVATTDETISKTTALESAPLPVANSSDEKYVLSALAGELERITNANSGEGNSALNTAAMKVAQLFHLGFFDKNEIKNNFVNAYLARGGSHKDSAEAGKTFDSGWNKGVKEPRTPEPTETNRQPTGQLKAEPWEKPICFLDKLKLPKFPANHLPSSIRDYVENVAASRQVPVDLPALLAIAVAGAAGARRYRVYIGESHSEPLNIWTAIAMPPGSRKSDTYNDIVEPLYIEQRRRSAESKPLIELARADAELLKKRKDAALSRSVKSESAKQEYLELCQQSIETPPFPCLVASGDTTPEAAAELLCEQGGKIAFMDTEGGLFGIIAGRYDSNSESNLDVWLKMHAGDELSVHRRNKPPIEVSKPAGTIAVTVQPSVIKDLAAKKGFRDRGLLGRFLYAIPESLVGTRFYKNRPINRQKQAAYFAAIQSICNQPEAKPANEYDSQPHHRLYLRGDALEIWKELYNDIEQRQGKSGDLENISDWASKCAGAVARIAGIFHIIETGGDPRQNEISLETISAAYEICRLHLIEHAKAAYGLMSLGSEYHLAKDILAWIAANKKESFTVRDFWAGNRSKAKSSDELLPSFDFLVDREILREIHETNNRRGRNPKHKYSINPACKNCFRCLNDEQI